MRTRVTKGVRRVGLASLSGITAPVHVLGALVEREMDEVIFHGITPAIHSLARGDDDERDAANAKVLRAIENVLQRHGMLDALEDSTAGGSATLALPAPGRSAHRDSSEMALAA